ncbi:MAG: RNA 2',3'-cyclic phosphodiesterase [Anaerolineaceae bacterium]|nr:RNA 2',3'-cyclic phosphodiesterase [Anaerolineaceae bacterium]
MADLRLFIAVELPDAAKELLAAVQRELQQADARVKWSRPENIHLTLKFLGDTPEEFLDDLSAALDEAAAGHAAHTARVAQVGAFPNVRRPRVIWVGLDEPTGQLPALQRSVEEATSDLVEPERRSFAAHLTLGRVIVKDGGNLTQLSRLMEGYRLNSFSSVEVPVNQVVLIRSELSPSGPTYTPLHRSPLNHE